MFNGFIKPGLPTYFRVANLFIIVAINNSNIIMKSCIYLKNIICIIHKG